MNSNTACNIVIIVVLFLILKQMKNNDHKIEKMISLNDNVNVTGSLTVGNPLMIRKVVFTNQMNWYLPSGSGLPWTLRAPRCDRYMSMGRIFIFDVSGNEIFITKTQDANSVKCTSGGPYFPNEPRLGLTGMWDLSSGASDGDKYFHGGGTNEDATRIEIDLGSEQPVSSVWAVSRYHGDYWARNNHIMLVCFNNANKVVYYAYTGLWNSYETYTKKLTIQV